MPNPVDVIDTTKMDDHEDSESSDGDNVDYQEQNVDENLASGSKPKKKKKKSKAARALAALKGKNQVPQEFVDKVVERLKAEVGDDAEGADEETVRQAIDFLKINDVIKGKAGIAGRGRKDMGEHKFWATQPVPQLGEAAPLADGYIEESTAPEQVRQEPYPLPKEFQWSKVDIMDSAQLTEVYELLSAHYVEDHDASFRFQYTAPFLLWALKPPDYISDWHIGVRVASNKKLVAFISGVPVTLDVRGNKFASVEINFLCVHKKLRSKRLAPVLIKEVTRHCHLKGIFQAIYTAGVLLPTPISMCRYFHRPLNIPKLVDVKFTSVPRNMTVARMIRLHKLPEVPVLAQQGLREAENKDVDPILRLFSRFMQRYDMKPVMTFAEAKHNFLSGRGHGDMVNGRRQDQVVWTYVVENPETHKITDFFSFYTLPSSVIGSPKHAVLEAAYLFYYASDLVFAGGAEVEEKLEKRLKQLVGDALIIAEQAKFDVFNALTLMDNWLLLRDLKFGSGDGLLNYYLYNWRTAPLAGMSATEDRPIGRGIGVVML